MRKFLISIICALCMGTAFAAGENVATSKAFVDTAVAQKQDKIPANAGTAQVLTNTGTAGSVGTKDVYDSTAAYVGQTDALVDAATMNAAVQNAVDTEFQCIEYNSSGECLLVNISVLPNEYTRLQYLESTGTQYIDSGVQATPSTGVAVRYAFTDFYGYNDVFGSFSPHYYMGINSSGEYMLASYAPSSGGAVISTPISNIQINQVYKFNMNLFESGKAEFVGIKSTQLPERTFEAQRNMFLFGVLSSTNVNHGAVRIYDMQITSGKQLIRNFIPARRKVDGVLGMYDTVNNTFYTNGGTGNFIAGEFMPGGN